MACELVRRAPAALCGVTTPAAVRALLSARQYRVPDVEGARAARCRLASFRAARRLRNKVCASGAKGSWPPPICRRLAATVVGDCNVYFALLFHAVAVLMAAAGLPLSLSRFDLFHGHLFVTDCGGKGPSNGPCRRLGILSMALADEPPPAAAARFHAMEYPAFCPITFPINLGYCQHGERLQDTLAAAAVPRPLRSCCGSMLEMDRSFDFRNILWLAPAAPTCAAVLVALDASPGTPVYDGLVGEDLGLVRTIYEGDFGDIVGDINYFASLSTRQPHQRIFVC
eukprot:SM002783S10003  [mRNA]  locus=s2783:22:1506:+ [translate_table: standard]